MQTSGARALREDDQRTARRTGRFERPAADPVPLRPRDRYERPAADPVPLRPRRDRSERPAPGERRTVTITGHPGYLPPRRRRSPAHQALIARPDRVAFWAFLLGLFLVLVAAATANAAVL